MEENVGERINNARVQQVLDVEVECVVSECPFCQTMLTDGLKAKDREEDVKSLDIAEIVHRTMVRKKTESDSGGKSE